MRYTPHALLNKVVLHPLRRLYWRVFRPRIFGVRCLVEHEGRILLVRNPYGLMKWDLPGGGVKRGESAEQAARREVSEEVGVTLTGLRPLGQYTGTEGYERDTVTCYYARAQSPELEIDRAEVYEAGWFEWGSLPELLSPEVERIIRLYRSPAG